MRVSIWLLVSLGFAPAVGCGVSGDPNAKPIPWNEQDHGAMALMEVQDFVGKLLKAPGTAQWPGMFESLDHVRSLGDQTYFVRSWVDAENSFGAHLRNSYTARVKEVAPDSWKLLYFKFDNSEQVYGSLDSESDAVPSSRITDKRNGKITPLSKYEYKPVVLNDEESQPEQAIPDKSTHQEDAKTKAVENAQFRTWTSNKGSYSIEAKLVSVAYSVATLETRDGAKKKVPMEKLSEVDQDFIKAWKRKH